MAFFYNRSRLIPINLTLRLKVRADPRRLQILIWMGPSLCLVLKNPMSPRSLKNPSSLISLRCRPKELMNKHTKTIEHLHTDTQTQEKETQLLCPAMGSGVRLTCFLVPSVKWSCASEGCSFRVLVCNNTPGSPEQCGSSHCCVRDHMTAVHCG